jgi:nuclear pore complex protein Nup98-Nup96
MSEAELARVRNLRFTRENVGSIHFHGETDVREVLPHLADVVLLQSGEVVVYPNPGSKPPIGTGLNKAADITLFGCVPKTQSFSDAKAKERYRRRVKHMTEEKGAEFLDYDCDRGIWKFRVNHF